MLNGVYPGGTFWNALSGHPANALARKLVLAAALAPDLQNNTT